MTKLTGFLIRKNRIEQNYSQEGLCKGICVVSYLSKIEQGLVNPSEEIVAKLFERLKISFVFDEAEIVSGRNMLDDFFNRKLYGESTAEIEEKICAEAEMFKKSELYISYHLFVLFSNTPLEEGLTRLEPFIDYMSDKEKYLFYTAKSRQKTSFDERVGFLLKAEQYMRQSSSKYALAKRYLKAGKYHEAESFASQALSLAIEEGNVYMMIESSLLIGHCYASINNVPLMLENYGYAENLSRGVNPAKKKEIDYNIGAVFVSIKRYDEALPRLLNSIPDEENDLSVMICHKLAIVYFEKNNPIEGRKWLNKGYDALSRNPNGLYKKMLELVEMRSNPGYLDSDGYESLLLDVCKNVGILGYGFKIFHNKYLTEYYTHKRKYKEAYGIALEMIDFLE